MEIKHCSSKEEIEMLKSDSALTLIGLVADEENLTAFMEWVKQYTEMKTETVYVISGKLMNESYDLRGTTRYRNNLNIVSIKLSDMVDPAKIVIPRFNIGGKWMDDIIENNISNNGD